MPELPEVETIVKKLHSVLENKVITGIRINREKSFQGDMGLVIGQPISAVSRRAKLIRFHFPNNLNVLAHLKMTGQFIFVGSNKKTGDTKIGGGHPSSDWVGSLPSKHTRVEIDLAGNDDEDNNKQDESLYFNDMRVFGWLKVMTDDEVQREYEKYGPDINTPEASIEYFKTKLKKTARKIKQVVMDNKIISGVGNIYACDGLNLAKIHPTRPANSLSDEELEVLLLALKEVIDLGIKLGGATISDYRDVDGFSGKYQDEVLTYGREGQECKNCPGFIEKIKVGGRGTYFCSSCQV
jgi:formamidopyrimidine-DNA glycosylase